MTDKITITIEQIGTKFHVEASSPSRDTSQLTVCHALADVMDQIQDTLADPDFNLIAEAVSDD